MAGSNEFGGRLFALREENNINKTKLAKILNMSRSMITMYESGERMPSIEVLLKISDYFSVSIDWLLGRTENKQLTVNKDHVPLGRTVKIPIIKTAITETPVGNKYKNKPPFDNLVVCKDNGEPYLPGSFSHIVKRAIIQKGLPKTSLHPLRHSFATLLLKYGTDIKVASSLLGHSRASFTQDTYQHTLDEMKYKTAKKISSRLLKKVDKDKKNSPQG